MISLPVPLSPCSSTFTSLRAMFASRRPRRTISALIPTQPGMPGTVAGRGSGTISASLAPGTPPGVTTLLAASPRRDRRQGKQGRMARRLARQGSLRVEQAEQRHQARHQALPPQEDALAPRLGGVEPDPQAADDGAALAQRFDPHCRVAPAPDQLLAVIRHRPQEGAERRLARHPVAPRVAAVPRLEQLQRRSRILRAAAHDPDGGAPAAVRKRAQFLVPECLVIHGSSRRVGVRKPTGTSRAARGETDHVRVKRRRRRRLAGWVRHCRRVRVPFRVPTPGLSPGEAGHAMGHVAVRLARFGGDQPVASRGLTKAGSRDARPRAPRRSGGPPRPARRPGRSPTA